MTRAGYLLVIISFFFFTPRMFGQVETKNIALKQLLDTLAIQHAVKFDYSDEDVKPYFLPPPDSTLPLKVKLVYIANRTRLGFKERGEYIIVYNSPPRPRKPLCAFVTDDMGQPVEDVVIQYRNQKILAGKDGYFEFPDFITELTVSQPSYQTQVYKVANKDNDCRQIKLALTVQQLDEVIAERYIATGITKQKDGSYNIKPSKFGILPGLTEPDVLQAMQQLPGINSVDETVSNINVRGGTHDQNLFLWNGLRLFQTGHFFGLISALNPNLAHDIKISKNGTSASYGESVSSAVDISSRPGEIGEARTVVSANMISADFYTRLKTSKNSNLSLTARRSFTDVLDFPTYEKYSKRIFQNTVITELNNNSDVYYKNDKEFYFYDFTAQFHQKIGKKNNFYADVIGIKNKLDFRQGTFTSADLVTKTSSLDQQTFGVTMAWRTQWDKKHSTEVGVYGSYYNVDANNEASQYNRTTRQENNIIDTGLRFTDNRVISTELNAQMGYQFNEIGVKNLDYINEPSYSRNAKSVLRTHSVFGELQFSPEGSPLFARFGLRLNYIEQLTSLYAEPRLQLTYKFKPGWALEVLGEKKSQTTSQVVQLQDDFLGIEKRRWVLANNKDIPVQRSYQASAGITYKQSGWLITLDNFYKRVNGITTQGQAFQNQFELQTALGSYTVYGTEFLVQKQFKHFYAWLSYSHNHNTYMFKGIDPSAFPSSFQLSNTLNSAVIYEWKKLKIALGSKFFTGRPYTQPLSTEPVYDSGGAGSVTYGSPNDANNRNFFQVNFSASYTINTSEKTTLQLGVSAINIFNRKNIINRYYRVNSTNNGIEQVNTYALERTPNALVKFSF